MILHALLTISLLQAAAGASLVCLYCTDAVVPADCDTVIQCGSHERCYVDAYVSATGSLRYNLGCRDGNQCTGPSNLGKREAFNQLTDKLDSMLTDKLDAVLGTNEELSRKSTSGFPNTDVETREVSKIRASGFLVCSECCTGNLCSNAGCGNKGYISPRGPICYHCAEQLSQDDCSKISLCGQDEVCMLQKTLNTMTHEVRYTTRCEGEKRCTDEILRYKQLASLLVGKRQKSSKRESLELGGSCVVQCCKTDMCNVDCNGTSSSHTSSLVPGSSMQPSATRDPVPYSTTVSVYKTTPTTKMSSVALSTTTTAYRTPLPVKSTTVYNTPQPPTITTAYGTPLPVKSTTVYNTPQPPTITTAYGTPLPVKSTTVYNTPQPPTITTAYGTPLPVKSTTVYNTPQPPTITTAYITPLPVRSTTVYNTPQPPTITTAYGTPLPVKSTTVNNTPQPPTITTAYGTPLPVRSTTVYNTPQPPTITTAYRTPLPVKSTTVYNTPQPPTTTTAYRTLLPVKSTTVYNTPQPPTTTTAYRTTLPVKSTMVYNTPQPPSTTASWVYLTPSQPILSTMFSTNSASFCLYKSKFYKQDDVWQDGCGMNCTCVDAGTASYKCQELCPTYTNLPIGCTLQKIPGECCSVPTCGTQGMCYYKNKFYREGEHWIDGCDLKCTCTNAMKGQYLCKSLCLEWKLPPLCYLYPPPPGKCCPIPVCPGNYTIQYPSGYSQE